jgi:adenylate cyclase
MSKIIDAIGQDKINRFSLSFKDAEMEKSFLEENNKWLHRMLILGFIVMMVAFPVTYLIAEIIMNMIVLPFTIWLIAYIYIILMILFFIYMPPNPRVTQLLLAIFLNLFVGLYACTRDIGTAFDGALITGLIVTVVFSYTIIFPLRFVYAIPAYTLVIFVPVLAQHFAWHSSESMIEFIRHSVLMSMSFAFASVISFFGLYVREAYARINFYQQQSINDYSNLLKKMFGRYLSTEVMNTLIENPSALELGGEKRQVMIMMTDLRGFVALTERLKPEKVVEMLNAYFEVMLDIVVKYNGTINEIIGDALQVFFGAPQEMPDRAERAIACAIDMQNAMAKVNAENRKNGLPELEMGIGLNEAEVVVGNIGSSKRSKYTAVGSGVNLASRIESYTVGGQILVSESVKNKIADKIRIDNQMEVMPKGADEPLKLFEIGGISGDYNLAIADKDYDMATLILQIPFQYTIIEGKHVGRSGLKAVIKKLSKVSAEIISDEPLDRLSNIKVNLDDEDGDLSSKDLYAKVIDEPGENSYILRFTSVPAEVAAYFKAFRKTSH